MNNCFHFPFIDLMGQLQWNLTNNLLQIFLGSYVFSGFINTQDTFETTCTFLRWR